MIPRRTYLAGVTAAVSGCLRGRNDTETPSDVTGSWTHINGGSAGGTRATGTEPLDTAPTEAWSVALGESGRFLIDGDVLYTVSSEAFSRRSLADGSVRWNRTVDEFVRIGPSVGDRLYATTGHDDPALHAFAVPGGEEPTEEWSRAGVRAARADEELLVGVAGDSSRLFAFDADGTERWTITPREIADEAVDGFGPVVLGEDHVFAVAEQFPSTGWVAGLDRADGAIRWSAQDPNQNTVLAATPDVVVSAGNETGATGFSPTGNELWRIDTDGRVETAAIVGDRVFLNERPGSVTALTTRGDEMWTREGARVVSVDSEVAYAVGDGLSALGVEDGDQRWALDTEATEAVPAGGGLFGLAETGPQNVSLSLYQ